MVRGIKELQFMEYRLDRYFDRFHLCWKDPGITHKIMNRLSLNTVETVFASKCMRKEAKNDMKNKKNTLY